MVTVTNGAFPVKANGIAVCFGHKPVNITKIRVSHLCCNNVELVHGCATGFCNLKTQSTHCHTELVKRHNIS